MIDAVNLGCDIADADPRDVTDGGGVEFLEVKQHQLPIEWLQPVNQREYRFEGLLPSELGFAVALVVQRLGVIPASCWLTRARSCF